MNEQSRREFIVSLAAAPTLAAVHGCSTTQSIDLINRAAYCIGGAAGQALGECGMSQTSRDTLVEVMSRVVAIVPDEGQTLEAAWVKKAQAHVDELVATGDIGKTTGVIVMLAFSTIVRAYDIVEERYPVVKTVRELAAAAISGFATGFLASFSLEASVKYTVDYDAYMELSDTVEVKAIKLLTSSGE